MPGDVRTVREEITRNWREIDNERTVFSLSVQHAAACIGNVVRQALRPFGLTFAEFEVLCALRVAGPGRETLPSDLQQRILISSGGLTKVLVSLQGRGLIGRPRSQTDARRKPVVLLPDGRRLVERAMIAVQKAEEAFLTAAGITDADIAKLNPKIASVSDRMSRTMNAPP